MRGEIMKSAGSAARRLNNVKAEALRQEEYDISPAGGMI